MSQMVMDPQWEVRAERETVERLQAELSARRAARELARVAAEASVVTPLHPEPPVQPFTSNMSAIVTAPLPSDPEWHDWAERQTVLRLRSRRVIDAPPPPPVLESSRMRRVIRVHHENLQAVALNA